MERRSEFPRLLEPSLRVGRFRIQGGTQLQGGIQRSFLRFFFVLTLIAGSFQAIGCSPGLGKQIRVGALPIEDTDSTQDSATTLRAHVLHFQDSRGNEAIATINGRKVLPENDVGGVVQDGLERLLKSRGVELSLISGPVIMGDVTTWEITVAPGFPVSTAEATAAVKLNLQAPDGHPVYSATYSGSTVTKNPFLTEAAIQEALGDAMTSALREALNDPKLFNSLQQYSVSR